MSHTLIPIPGGGTILDDRPIVEVVSKRYELVQLVIKYHSCYSDEGSRMGELTFKDVFQYRWTYDEIDYNDFESDADDFEFGLIEITNSPYIADILSKSQKYRAGRGLAEQMRFYNVRHFRLGFDEYGCFDIIADDVSVREIETSS